MKGIVSAAAAVAALGVVAPPALAQEAGTGFNGIYVGVAGGYDVQPNDTGSRVEFDRNLDGTFGDTVLATGGGNAFTPGFCNGRAVNRLAPAAGGRCVNDKDNGAVYGRVGIDSQRGAVVIGVVGEFGTSWIKDGVTAFSTTPASYVFSRGIDWEAGIRARAGFTPNDRTLFYGTFGPGYARIDRSFNSSQSTNTFTGRGDRDQFGFQGGGGVEQRIFGNVSIGLEYLYHQYRDDEYRVRVAGGPTTAPFTPFTNTFNGASASGTDLRRSDDKFRWHSLRATASLRF